MEDLSRLMVSVSGIRGRIQDGFGPSTILHFSLAFASYAKGDWVVIGRDTRPSGPFVESILQGAILSAGKNVLSLGIVPTPTVKAVVNALELEGGVVVSASHNPLEWNAFKFIRKGGFFFRKEDIDQVLRILQSREYLPPVYDRPVRVEFSPEKVAYHTDSVLSRVDVLAIRKKNFKVALDAVNGAGSTIVPQFLEKLGCEVYKLHCKPDGIFPRPPEPTEDALAETSRFVREHPVDIGFALDPDADRLVVLTPKRGALSEEYTLPLCLLSVLKSYVGIPKVIVNESTSLLTDRIVQAYGGKVIRSKVGEANVVDAMLEHKAMFGGEGNGGVIDPKVASFGRDALSGIAHILNAMALENQSIDSLCDKFPELYMKKTQFPRENRSLDEIYSALKKIFPKGEISEQDGLRISWVGGWIHARPSNTEPIVRIIAEAGSQEELDQVLEQVDRELFQKS